MKSETGRRSKHNKSLMLRSKNDWGPSAKIEDFDDQPDIETANYDLYEDGKQGPDVAQDWDGIPDDS
jgi:hypothetical protein